MKTVLFAFFVLIAVEIHAQKDEGIVLVPIKVHQKFLLENPEIRATWKAGRNLYTAQYINPINNMGYTIVYDTAGTVLRREKELENQDYPPQINDYFNQRFPGEGFVVWSSIDSAGLQTFFTHHNSSLIRFDKNGNLMAARKNTRSVHDSLAPAVSR